MKRVILTTGGTGGHIFPALAVAESIKENHKGAHILFIGGRYGLEKKLVTQAGIDFMGLSVRGVLGRGHKAFFALAGLFFAVLSCLWVMFRFKPQVVLGFGGYAGFAPVLAAALYGIPCAIHEQNSIPGSANKLLGRFVKQVFLSFPDAKAYFKEKKTVLVGNPIRKELMGKMQEAKEYKPRNNVLILGGSQGAQGINKAVVAALKDLAKQDISLWHQCGPKQEKKIQLQYKKVKWVGSCPQAEAFIQDMGKAYMWADVVVCRSGATTVAELAALGKASLLIPFPGATHNHQFVNAKYLEQAGAAVLIEEKDLTADRLVKTIKMLLADRKKLQAMGSAAKALAKPYAGADIVQVLEKMATSHHKGKV